MNDLIKKLKLLANWKRASILILIASFTLGASSCPGNAPKLNWKPQIWAGDSGTESIVRKSGDKWVQIKASDSRFNDYVAMKSDEISKAEQAYFDVINQCEKWKPATNIQQLNEGFINEDMGMDSQFTETVVE